MSDEKSNIKIDGELQCAVTNSQANCQTWRLVVPKPPTPIEHEGEALAEWCKALAATLNGFQLNFVGTEPEFESRFGEARKWFDLGCYG